MVNLDYLIINGSLDRDYILHLEEIASKDFSLNLMEYGTQNLSKIAEIYYKGKKFGVVSWLPYTGSVIEDTFIQLQIENSILYEPLNILRGLIYQFMYEFKIKFEGFNRVDICLDSPLRGKFFNVFQGTYRYTLLDLNKAIQDAEISITGKEKKMKVHTSSTGKVYGWDLGTRSGSRFIRFYNKSKEMREKINKPWISESWERSGFNENFEDQEIYRFEVQFNRSYLKDTVSFDELFDKGFQLEMMNKGLLRFFDCREHTGKNRVTDEKPISFFPWREIEKEIEKRFPWNDKAIEFNPPKRKNEIHYNSVLSNKILLKKMFIRYLVEGDESLVSIVMLTEIFKLKYGFDYRNFFEAKHLLWLQDYQKKADLYLIFNRVQFDNDVKMVSESMK